MSDDWLPKAKALLAEAEKLCNQSTFMNTERQYEKKEAVLKQAYARQDPNDPNINGKKADEILNSYDDKKKVLENFQKDFVDHRNNDIFVDLKKWFEGLNERIKFELRTNDLPGLPSSPTKVLRKFVACSYVRFWQDDVHSPKPIMTAKGLVAPPDTGSAIVTYCRGSFVKDNKEAMMQEIEKAEWAW
ncbi:MAG: hypothetical protein Q9216_001100 [Gyalolechia sp. 2 TL-2023]